MATWAIVLLSLLALAGFISWRFLSVPDLRRYDTIDAPVYPSHPDEADARSAVMQKLEQVRNKMRGSFSPKRALMLGREFADNLSSEHVTDSTIITVQQDGVDGEWVIAANAKPNRRMIYFHGGAFLVGSAQGHRQLTDKLSQLSEAAVLAVNYRKSPEHGRMAGIEDAQNAYQWFLNNEPHGAQAADFILLGGDSAGGNLALMLSRWSKTCQQQPDGVICFSPSTDYSLSSTTVKSNQKTDPILCEGLGFMSKIPVLIRNWIALLVTKANPSSPLVSPVLGDLSELPPTFIAASTNEMLLGDSVRYTNRAREAGSQVDLRLWENQIHDWPLFFTNHAAADDTWVKVSDFLTTLNANTSKQ